MSDAAKIEHCVCGARATKRCEDWCSGGHFVCGRPLCAAHDTCPKPSVEMRPLWSKEPCESCGAEDYATRTRRRPKSEPYICGECQAASQATASADAEIAALKVECDQLREALRALLATQARCQRCCDRVATHGDPEDGLPVYCTEHARNDLGSGERVRSADVIEAAERLLTKEAP